MGPVRNFDSVFIGQLNSKQPGVLNITTQLVDTPRDVTILTNVKISANNKPKVFIEVIIIPPFRMRSFPIVVSKSFLHEYQFQNQVKILHDHVAYPLKHTLKSTFQVSKIACYEFLKNIEIRSKLKNEVGMCCQTQNQKHLDTMSRT